MVMRTLFAVLVMLGLAPAAQAGALDQLRAFLDGTRTGRANFVQVVEGKSARKATESRGTMAFERPGRFRWTYATPYEQLIVGDGTRLWVYDRELNQVTVRTLGDALGASPAALLAGDNALEKSFTLRDGGAVDGIEWVEATPKSADTSFRQVRIGFADGRLRAMVLADAFGQTTRLAFADVERNPKLDAALFRFTPPPGADVVGE